MKRITESGFYWVKIGKNWTIVEAIKDGNTLVIQFLGGDETENADYIHFVEIKKIKHPEDETE